MIKSHYCPLCNELMLIISFRYEVSFQKSCNKCKHSQIWADSYDDVNFKIHTYALPFKIDNEILIVRAVKSENITFINKNGKTMLSIDNFYEIDDSLNVFFAKKLLNLKAFL